MHELSVGHGSREEKEELGSSFESRQPVFPSYVTCTTRWERFYYTDFQSGEKIDTVARAPSAPFRPHPHPLLSPPPYTNVLQRAPPFACRTSTDRILPP